MHTLIRHFVAVWSALALLEPAAALPLYNIVPLGFDDLEHTRNDGSQFSGGYSQVNREPVVGSSARFNGGSTNLGNTAWLYDGAATISIGLVGPEHTRNDGYKPSYQASIMNSAGQVSGFSRRYNGGSIQLGDSVWLYDGTTTKDIGLIGPEHTRSDGYKYSYQRGFNEAGQVIGSSWLYNGGGSAISGLSVWLYNGETTIDIGLTGGEYTGIDGQRSSYVYQINSAGRVIGASNRYNGADLFGGTGWLYDGANTIPIGLFGPEHTAANGYRIGGPDQINEAGQVRGSANRYGGTTNLGRTIWFYDGETTTDIGLTGAEHTRNDGYKSSSSYVMNQAGQVRGYSNRYNGGSADRGRSSWLYDGNTTIDIGFTGPEHTRSDGYRFSDSGDINEMGQVTGYSYRYNGGFTERGQTAWLYDGETTIITGLLGGEHTRSDGSKSSTAQQLNEAGQVRGYSSRFNGGSTDLGRSSWLYDGNTTIDISPTDSQHSRNDGYRYSATEDLNEAGQVSGLSYRYSGSSTQLGQDAWLYDPVLDQTLVLNLSTRSDGYAFSRIDYLGDDGLVLGVYTLFDAQDNTIGDRAFYFTVTDGLHDLGSLVAGGLAANGWDYLAGDSSFPPVALVRPSALGKIVGHGKRTSQSDGLFAFLLNPVEGDFNDDGAIDAADYVLWRKNGGAPADYDAWRANFGTMGSPRVASSVAPNADFAVPEPSAVLLAGFTSLISATLTRRRR